MPEETTPPAQSVTATQTTATSTSATGEQTVDITKYINNDGSFKEGYKELVPEELRSNKFYDIFHDIQGVMKAAGHQAVTLGKYGTTKGVLPISEKSSPYEVETFRTAMGVPKDSTGYKYTPPEDISTEDLSPEFMKETFDTFNKSNYTQPQVDAAMNLYTNHLRQVEKVVNEEIARQVSDAENRLDSEWGDKRETRLNLAKEFITNVVGHWSREKYEELFGKDAEIKNADGTITKIKEGGINDPEFAPVRILLLELFADIQEKFGIEDSALVPETTGTARKTVDQQIEEIDKALYENVQKKSSLDSKERAEYDELVKQRDILYHKKYPV